MLGNELKQDQDNNSNSKNQNNNKEKIKKEDNKNSLIETNEIDAKQMSLIIQKQNENLNKLKLHIEELTTHNTKLNKKNKNQTGEINNLKELYKKEKVLRKEELNKSNQIIQEKENIINSLEKNIKVKSEKQNLDNKNYEIPEDLIPGLEYFSLDKTEKKYVDMKNKLDGLLQENKNNEFDIVAFKTEKALLKNIIQEKENIINSLEKNLNTTKTTFEKEIEQTKEQFEAKTLELKVELEQIKKNNQAFEKKLEAKKVQFSELEKKLADRNTTIKSLRNIEKEFEELKIKHEEINKIKKELIKQKNQDIKLKEMIINDVIYLVNNEIKKYDLIKLYKTKEFFESYFFNERKNQHDYIENGEIEIVNVFKNDKLIQVDFEANDLSYNSLMYKFNDLKKVLKKLFEPKIENILIEKNIIEKYSLTLEILQKQDSVVDSDNLVLTFKMFNKIILDSLIENKILLNDNIECLQGGINLSLKLASISKNKLTIKINKI